MIVYQLSKSNWTCYWICWFISSSCKVNRSWTIVYCITIVLLTVTTAFPLNIVWVDEQTQTIKQTLNYWLNVKKALFN